MTPQKAIDEMYAYGDAREAHGRRIGIAHLETVRGWLTRQPQRKWAIEMDGWVAGLIDRERVSIAGLEGVDAAQD